MVSSENQYFDLSEVKKSSPSLKDGIDFSTESRYRTEGVQFITKLGQKMNLRYVTTATGTVYFHRFYMHHSFKEFHRLAVATTCLFLAGKVEETPKKARDIFRTIQANGLISENEMVAVFGDDPKEELLTMERILLKTMKFDLQVDHPYKFLIKYAKTFVGDKSKIEKVVQNCWGFINDSQSTTLCLQWEPEIVAIALMDLACRVTKYDVTDWHGKPSAYKGKWWDQFVSDVSLELLESICHQVLDLYSAPASSDKPAVTPAQQPVARQTSDSSHKRASTSNQGHLASPTKMSRSDKPPSVSVTAHPQTAVSQAAAYPSAPVYSSHSVPSYSETIPSVPVSTSAAYAMPPHAAYPGYPAPPPLRLIAPGTSSYQQPTYYSQPPVVTHQPPPTVPYYSQPMVPGGYQGYPPSVPQTYPHPTAHRGQGTSNAAGQRRNSSLKVLTDS